MKKIFTCFYIICATAYGDEANAPDPLIALSSVDATIIQEMRYATQNNFMKERLYSDGVCVVRRPVALALARVQQAARLQHVKLKVLDCYRPISVQKKMWNKIKDDRYVADPSKGAAKHSRGAAVDVTLVSMRDDTNLEMPSEYDDFTSKAHRNSKKSSKRSRQNSAQLEKLMVQEGFIPLATEWWHFDYAAWEKYPAVDVPLSEFK